MPGLDPISSILNLGSSIIDRVWPNPEQKAEIEAKKSEAQLALLKLSQDGQLAQMANDLQAQIAVNETMRAEAASPHWLQWAWRPIFGLAGAAVIVNNYILLPYLQGFGVKVIDIPDKVWEVILAVVGVSALTRGLEKVVQQWSTTSTTSTDVKVSK